MGGSKKQLKVFMSDRGMADGEIGAWCSWFEARLRRMSENGSKPFAVREVDFSENHLTAAGVQKLLDTCRRNGLKVAVLNLQNNLVEQATGINEFIQGNRGSLQELNLSHNELDTDAVMGIVVAAASARDTEGRFAYPRPAQQGGRAVPLWLQVDANFADPAQLHKRLQPALEKLERKGGATCAVESAGCTPHHCVRRLGQVPAVHVAHLASQREPSSPPGLPAPFERLALATKTADVVGDAVYSRAALLFMRVCMGKGLRRGTPLIKQMTLPRVVEPAAEAAVPNDDAAAASWTVPDETCVDVQPAAVETRPRGRATQSGWPEPDPTAVACMQLLACLRRAPGQRLDLADLQGSAPEPLRPLVQDAASMRVWLQHWTGIVDVSGLSGLETVTLKPGSSGPRRSREMASLGYFCFNPDAAVFQSSAAADLDEDDLLKGCFDVDARCADLDAEEAECRWVAESASPNDSFYSDQRFGHLQPEDTARFNASAAEFLSGMASFYSLTEGLVSSGTSLHAGAAEFVPLSSMTLNPQAAEFTPGVPPGEGLRSKEPRQCSPSSARTSASASASAEEMHERGEETDGTEAEGAEEAAHAEAGAEGLSVSRKVLESVSADPKGPPSAMMGA